MSDDIPFDKRFDLPPGQVEEVVPGIRRILCNNPGPFTYKGTVSYILGRGRVAIIDPGPLDEAHIAALLDAVRGETVTHIFVTHTHRDHSPAAAPVKAATGAPVYAEGPHRAARPLNVGEGPRLDAGGDTDFRPDQALADGDVVSGDGWALEAVDHARPHRQPHGVRATRHRDAVLRRSRHGVVDAGGGAARRRDERLHGVAREARAARRDDLPARATAARCATRRSSSSTTFVIARRARRRSCAGLPRARPISRRWCRAIYIGLDPRLTKAAGLSVLAHLEDLVARGEVVDRGRAGDRRHATACADRSWRSARPSWARGSCGGAGRIVLLLRDGVVDLVHQAADARGVGAEIEAAVA